jgi:nitrogen fixation protein FixH
VAAKGWYWPVAIVGLLVAGAAANIGFMIVANRDATFAVEPDYYRKAVDWDRTMAQEARNVELGWQVSTQLERIDGGRARLVARVADRDGRPVTDAAVVVEAFPSARARDIASFTLAPAGSAGAYAATLARARTGLWELRVRVTRGEEVFTRTISQDLAAAR